MASEIHVDDIGTQLIVTIKDDGVPVDVSLASSIQIVITKPNTSKMVKTATFYTDGTDGLIYYTSILGDFDSAGVYEIQGIVNLSGGTYHSSISTFKVYRNL